MSKPKKHHYVPRFYLNYWNNSIGNVRIYVKGNADRFYNVLAKDICFEKNLYTKSNGRVDVEVNFFGQVDGNASSALKVLLNQGVDYLDSNSKASFTLFINTLHARSPAFVNMLRDFEEKNRIKGATWADKIFIEQNEDIRADFIKKDHCDSPFLIEYHSKGKDYDTILNAHWEIFENMTKNDFITSDFPLIIYPLGGVNKYGYELPDSFLITLPISPKKSLIITNNKSAIPSFTRNPKVFVTKTNESMVINSKEIIISKDNTSDRFILNRISLLKK